MPKRIQRRRTKGWRMPENTVSVTRPGRYGNKYRVGIDGTAEECVAKFREDAERAVVEDPSLIEPLRDHDVACWCREDAPHCHGDVWLDLANRPNA